MKAKRCALLLSTCDSYSDTWEPFFDLLRKFWPDIPYRVFVNTETKKNISLKDLPFEINVCNTNTNDSWSKRLLKVLDMIEEDYIFMVLDDFFIKAPVVTNLIEKLIDRMEKEQNIASFQLKAARLIQEGKSVPGEDLITVEVGKDGWKTHFVPTIWRKKVLVNWLRAHESIWGFELYGSQRARRWNYKETVYAVESPIIYDYLWIDGCSVIVNGKWLESDYVDDFFAQNDILINLNERGRISLEEYRSRTMKDTLKNLTMGQIIKKTIYRIRSIW